MVSRIKPSGIKSNFIEYKEQIKEMWEIDGKFLYETIKFVFERIAPEMVWFKWENISDKERLGWGMVADILEQRKKL